MSSATEATAICAGQRSVDSQAIRRGPMQLIGWEQECQAEADPRAVGPGAGTCRRDRGRQRRGSSVALPNITSFGQPPHRSALRPLVRLPVVAELVRLREKVHSVHRCCREMNGCRNTWLDGGRLLSPANDQIWFTSGPCSSSQPDCHSTTKVGPEHAHFLVALSRVPLQFSARNTRPAPRG